MTNPNDNMAAAVAAHQRGQLEAAERLYLRVIKQAPNYAPAVCYLGIVLVQQGKAAAALKPLAAAIQALPSSVEAHAHYGLALAMSGDNALALPHFDRALQLDPRNANVLQNRGNALKLLRRFDEAIETFGRAITLSPRNPELHNNLGTVLAETGRFADAVASYDRTLTINPSHADAHENRGNALSWLGRHEDALHAYRRALSLRPDSPDLHYALAYAHLRHGDYREGFKEYEWRLRQPDNISRQADYRRPLWLGTPPLDGKSILLASEQGLGDTLQFARYVPLVAAMGARVVLRVQSPLRALLAALPGVAITIDQDENIPPTDYHCPLPSLPLAFATEIATIPSPGAYIAAPAGRIEPWRERLPQARRRIGIAWRGNPKHRDDRLRSMALAQFAPLLQTPGTAFVSLNPGIPPEEAAALAAMPSVTNLAPDLRDFADTAAVLASLDLVIAVDTAIAHLAGAIGRPVWIMIASSNDWRWLNGREDSPWYPTVRLFRQPAFGDWGSVVARVGRELQGL